MAVVKIQVNADLKKIRQTLAWQSVIVRQSLGNNKYVIYKNTNTMNDPKIPLSIVAQRLEKAIHADVGMRGLYILLYGWQQQRIRRGFKSNIRFGNRKIECGEPYIFLSELFAFSRYAGYDLT